ncbi:MAG: hypothetical protein ACPG2Y_01610, partial [Acholeplasmataceae bacterium]
MYFVNRYEPFSNWRKVFREIGQDALKDNFIPGAGGVYKVQGFTPKQLMDEFVSHQMPALHYEQVMFAKLLSDTTELCSPVTAAQLERSNCYIRVEPFDKEGNVIKRDDKHGAMENSDLYLQINYWNRRFG